MTRYEVVNRQVIDGKEYKRGQVFEGSRARIQDLLDDGKVREVADSPKPAPIVKGAVKNG